MTKKFESGDQQQNQNDVAPPPGLPSGVEMLRIAFASDRPAERTLGEFHAPERSFAVVVGPDAASSLTLLCVPSHDVENPELMTKIRQWVGEGPAGADPSVMITLHGAQIVWRTGRGAIVAPAERVAAARTAVVEFAFHEGQVRAIEQEIAARWPEIEGDAPLAFDFQERWMRRRDELARRFQNSVMLRGRFARLLPLVHRPPVHPPTLASQISERLRERTRIADRLDFCDQQLEVFERVYDLCGERTSEFFLARKGHMLEWVIIVFLAFQTLLLVLERIAATGT